eukprot:5135085-Prymnesium_polylepis.1
MGRSSSTKLERGRVKLRHVPLGIPGSLCGGHSRQLWPPAGVRFCANIRELRNAQLVFVLKS